MTLRGTTLADKSRHTALRQLPRMYPRPSRVRFYHGLFTMLLGSLMSSCTPASSANPNDLGLSEPAKRSNLIVVARVLGLADDKPEAQTRRHREMHLIQVTRTLKGHDMRGQRLAVRPNSLVWHDGDSYLFFLKSEIPASSRVQAVLPQPVLAATPANIDAVVDVVALQGGTVRPRLILWMTETTGYGLGAKRELLLAETGSFEWRRHSDETVHELTGRLSQSTVDTLLADVAVAATPIPPDDAPFVVFNWLDADGEVHEKVLRADTPATSTLLQRIEQSLGVN